MTEMRSPVTTKVTATANTEADELKKSFLDWMKALAVPIIIFVVTLYTATKLQSKDIEYIKKENSALVKQVSSIQTQLTKLETRYNENANLKKEVTRNTQEVIKLGVQVAQTNRLFDEIRKHFRRHR